jgi:hypothetical protein
MKIRHAAIVLSSIFALSACGGSSPNASPAGGAMPAAQPAVTAPDHKRKKRKLVPIRITLTMPHKKKRHKRGQNPKYISPDSTQTVITLNTVNGNPPPAGLLKTVTTNLVLGTNCTVTGGVEACIVSGPSVPVGDDNLTFTAGDGTNTLSTVTKTFTVVAGQANAFNASLLGIPASFTISPLVLNPGTASPSIPVQLIVRDADGDWIVGPGNYATPVSLQSLEGIYDNFGAVQLRVNGGTPSSAVTVANTQDDIEMSYSGLSITPFELEASATGASTGLQMMQVNTVNPAAVCADGGAHVCAAGPQVNLYDASPNAGSTANVTVTQSGWTESPFLQDISETDNCGVAGADIASIAQSSSTNPGGGGTVFNVTTLGTPSTGASCSITLTGGDPTGVSLVVPVTYTVSGITVNGRRRHLKVKP